MGAWGGVAVDSGRTSRQCRQRLMSKTTASLNAAGAAACGPAGLHGGGRADVCLSSLPHAEKTDGRARGVLIYTLPFET